MTLSDQEFYEIAKPIVWATIYRSNVIPENRDDVAQEAYVRAWKYFRLHSSADRTHEEWVKFAKAIVRNNIKFTLYAYYEMISQEIPYNPIVFAEIEERSHSLIDELTRAASYGYLYSALDRLPPGQRQLIYEVFWRSTPTSQINWSNYKKGLNNLRSMLDAKDSVPNTERDRVYRESLWYDLSSTDEFNGAISE